MHSSVGKAMRRILPLLVLMFVFNFMDRVNVGFAALQMNRELGFTPFVYGLGAGMFFVSYFLFEVPSNIALHRFGARLWLSRIAVTWGLVACATAFVQGATSFYVMRFLLGVAEAGFYPGVVFFLSQWFPERERARALALFQTGQAVAVIIGGPLSTWLLSMGSPGFSGWRWMMIVEGIPSILLGLTCLVVLRDSPRQVTWLTPWEQDWLVQELAREKAAKPVETTALKVLTDRRVIPYAFVYFCIVIAVIGMTLWMPQIIRSLGVESTMQIGLLSAIPWIIGLIIQFCLSTHSDHTGERKWHVGLAMACCAVAFIVSATIGNPVGAFIAIALAMGGLFATGSLFWTLPTTLLGGVAAASAIAFINSSAMVGGFLGPFLIGWIRGETGSYTTALVSLAGVLVVGAGIVLTRKPGRDYVARASSEARA
jgi:MFS transporter, ACS family, tartrate transporter